MSKRLKSTWGAAILAVLLVSALSASTAFADDLQAGEAPGLQADRSQLATQDQINGSTDFGDGYYLMFDDKESYNFTGYHIDEYGSVTPDVWVYFYGDETEPCDEYGRTYLPQEWCDYKYEMRLYDQEWVTVDAPLEAGHYYVTVTPKPGYGYTGYLGKYFDVMSDYDLDCAYTYFDSDFETNNVVYRGYDIDYAFPAYSDPGLVVNVYWQDVPWNQYEETYFDLDTDEEIGHVMPTTPGYYYCRVDGIGSYHGSSLTANFCVYERDLDYAVATGVQDSTYTGSAITFKPTVEDLVDGEWMKLDEGVDYKLSYSNNVNVGTATVTYTGIGPYEGTMTETFKIAPAPMARVAVVGIANKVYTGRPLTQPVSVTDGSRTLVQGKDYEVAYSKNVNAGTATVKIIGEGNYTGTVTKTFKISKAKNPMTAKAKSKTISVKASKLKKKAQTVTKAKAFKISKAKGKVTFKKMSGNKKITVNKKTGKFTLKKGLKKGTYKVKVKVSAKGTANYKASSKNVTLKFKVK